MDPLQTKVWCLRCYHLRRRCHRHHLHLRRRLLHHFNDPHYHFRYWHCFFFDFQHHWVRKAWVDVVYVWVPFEPRWLVVLISLQVLFLIEPRSNRSVPEVFELFRVSLWSQKLLHPLPQHHLA